VNLLRELDDDDRVMSGAVMTTYPFAPRFFEQAVLPALRDKSVDGTIAILADQTHYDATLAGDTPGEAGEDGQPRYAGQRYHLAPVSAGSQNAFHPKVHYIAGERRVQATVASANLTHPGLTNNQEVATRLTVESTGSSEESDDTTDHEDAISRSEQAAICTEIASFLRSLVNSPFGQSIDAVTRNTIKRTLSAGEWVEDVRGPGSGPRTAHFLHMLDDPLVAQLREMIADRNEDIQQVDIAAPFYGTSLAVPGSFTGDGIETRLWLQEGRAQILLEELAEWLEAPEATARSYDSKRYVHGKVLRVKTDSADYCLSGSPNASRSALLAAAEDGGNVEAAVLRRANEPGYFDYLFGSEPFTNSEPLDIESFDADETLPLFANSDDDEADQLSEAGLELHGVGFQRRESYDGGKLTVSGTATGTARTLIQEEGAELTVRPTDSDEEPTPIRLRSREFDWDEATSPPSFVASRDIYGDANERPLISTARAYLKSGEYTSAPRWVQTHTPTTGEPTDADVENAGATTVPRALTKLYQEESERQMEVISSLNGLLSALRDVENGGDDDGDESESNGREGPSGGLRVRPWTQSTSTDPDDLIESFYDGWNSDLSTFVRKVNGRTYYFEEVETRLRAINATTIQILLLDEAWPNLDVARQPALNAVKEVYSEQDLRGEEGTSLIAEYCDVLQHYAGRSDDRADEIYDGLQTHILPQVLLATIIAEAHIAGDAETFFNQQDWAFEALIGDCFEENYPRPADLADGPIDEAVVTIWDTTDGVRDRIEESRQLRRHADRRYMEEDHLERAVFELLGRSALSAGRAGVHVHQNGGTHQERMERVFTEFAPYLPDRKRRQMERLLE